MCPTFQKVCHCLRLLSDDIEKDVVIEEAASIRFGAQLRHVFATILMYSRPADPIRFWEKHQVELCRDFMIRDHVSELTPSIVNEVLLELQDHLEGNGLDLQRDFQLPRPDANIVSTAAIPRVIREETNYVDRLQRFVSDSLPLLNFEQRQAFNAVLASVEGETDELFGLDATGGTCKTFTLNLILAAVCVQRKIALATAMSGIAATLLHNGRTVHSRCKVPINIMEDFTCNMSPCESTAELFRQAKLLIIDEVSIGNRFISEAIDKTLQDIQKGSRLFGGITVVFVGD